MCFAVDTFQSMMALTVPVGRSKYKSTFSEKYSYCTIPGKMYHCTEIMSENMSIYGGYIRYIHIIDHFSKLIWHM